MKIGFIGIQLPSWPGLWQVASHADLVKACRVACSFSKKLCIEAGLLLIDLKVVLQRIIIFFLILTKSHSFSYVRKRIFWLIIQCSCKTLQHPPAIEIPLHRSSVCLFLVQWNPVNTVTNGPKTFGRINKGFFNKKMHGGFCQAAKKSGRNILPRWP